MIPATTRLRRYFELEDPVSGTGALVALSVAAILLLWPQATSISQFPISILDRSMFFIANAVLMLQPALLFAMRSSRWLKVPALFLFFCTLYLVYPLLLEATGLIPRISSQGAKGATIFYAAFCGVALFCNVPIAATNFANSAPRS
jgi:hypothetical protein